MHDIVNKIRSGVCKLLGDILIEMKKVDENELNQALEEQKKTNELLGQILVRKGLLTQSELVDILELQLANRTEQGTNTVRKKLGQILVEEGAISRWQLEEALKTQGVKSKKIGEILIELGYTTKGRIEEALSNQVMGTLQKIRKGTRKLLGEILLEMKRITCAELDRALEIQQKTNEYLGEILVREGLITQLELDEILAKQLVEKARSGNIVNKKIGEILLESRKISKEQLTKALELQRLSKKHIGEILIELGFVPRVEVQRALNLQRKLAALAMVSIVSLPFLNACGNTIVPIQTNIPVNYVTTSQFKTLNLRTPGIDKEVQINVHQDGSKVIQNVPFTMQGNDNTCGQAVMTMILNYWGINISYQQVVNETNPNNLPTTYDSITNYLRKKGLKAQDYTKATINNIIASINKGKPVIVLLDWGGASQEHYVVVVGYNQRKNTIIFHDSLDGPYMEMGMQQFDSFWNNKSISRLPLLGGANYNHLMFDVYR